ncbi:NACHT domain-containing protein [Mesorhizobium huakuii]|uniref:NACHT domain-containing protein n=1 Tax=Mesorhizobium huakuii TaxID=28104 RepID=A0A7G6T079_9HYPH|nr:NACHT domain-containing protein [Mesorhizobium huakuii]QND60161.1 NACHT domain-containing protein [Mesorhizobium huakuii]
MEAPQNADDFVVRFADGSRRFFQIKLSLDASGEVWKSLWIAFRRQLDTDFTPDDRLELVLGASTPLAAQLSELTKRHDSSDVIEWQTRLTASQRRLVLSIQEVLDDDIMQVWRVVTRLDVSIWPEDGIARDFVPQWMPPSSRTSLALFKALSDVAWDGATTRSSFNGSTLYDRLTLEFQIAILDPPNWGAAQYRQAVAALACVEVPGTDFRQRPDAHFLWPRCLRYDRDRRPDFDDDLPGWRDVSAGGLVDLRDFPSVDLGAVVVVAGPGFGKTTLVHAIAQKVATGGRLPAIIPATKLSDSDLSIADYLSERLNGEFEVRIDWRAAADAGSLLLLLDGLDEVSSDRRTVILERLHVYRANHPSVRWLMTVRDPAALSPPDDATMVELAPLQDEDISGYVNFYRPGESGVAEALLERIETRPDLAHLARIPIFLALMLVMRQEKANLHRSDLLDTYLETLFRPVAFKAAQVDKIDTAVLRQIAERAAFEALETDTIGISIKLLERCIKDIAPQLSTDDVREALVRRGLLRKGGLTRLTFPFPIVQEYLASAELLEHHQDQIAPRLGKIVRRPWAQAIQFALERHPNPEPLIDEILGREDDVFHTGLRLLGRCLANGMTVSTPRWQTMGDRFAEIWGGASWRTNKLINGIIVDAFSQPLHPAIRARLGERSLIHEGADTIVARIRDSRLSLEVLGELLHGNIENMLNLGDIQREADRLGTTAFNLYIAQCRRCAGEVESEHAISSLISHLKMGCVDAEIAFAAASDETLPLEIRLSAWSQSMRKLDASTEELIIRILASEGYHPMSSAAKALSSPQVDIPSILQLLKSPKVLEERALKVMEYLMSDWERDSQADRINQFLAEGGISEEMQNLASLFAVNAGNANVFDTLLDRIPTLSTEMVGATVIMFGHFLDRTRVERAVAAIGLRNWSPDDRVVITHSLTTGLTYRLKMMGLRSGTLESIPPHPGRTAPFRLLSDWLARQDYEPREYLKITLDAANLGVPGSATNLRAIFDTAMAAPPVEEHADGSLAGRALEVLHANREAPSLDELERLALSSTYNLASSVVGLIAKGGTAIEAESLMRLYESVPSGMLRSVILGVLEPLAGHLGLRITRSSKKLTAMAI